MPTKGLSILICQLKQLCVYNDFMIYCFQAVIIWLPTRLMQYYSRTIIHDLTMRMYIHPSPVSSSLYVLPKCISPTFPFHFPFPFPFPFTHSLTHSLTHLFARLLNSVVTQCAGAPQAPSMLLIWAPIHCLWGLTRTHMPFNQALTDRNHSCMCTGSLRAPYGFLCSQTAAKVKFLYMNSHRLFEGLCVSLIDAYRFIHKFVHIWQFMAWAKWHQTMWEQVAVFIWSVQVWFSQLVQSLAT